MRISIVHDARPGCAPSCGGWIAMQGRIEPGTAAIFARALRMLGKRRLPIFIESGGGSVPDAMAMGEQVRARHLDVFVTGTVFEACPARGPCAPGQASGKQTAPKQTSKPPGGEAGRPESAGAVCASACVLVLAAGDRRGAAPWTAVGVHRMLNVETRIWKRQLFQVTMKVVGGERVIVDRRLISEKPVSVERRTVASPQASYDRVGAYLRKMGMGPGLLTLMEATPASSIHMLTPDEEKASAIVTDAADGEFLLRSAPAAPPAQIAQATSTMPTTPTTLALPDPAAKVAAPEDAVLVEPGPGKATVKPGRVTWSAVAPAAAPPGAAPPGAVPPAPRATLRADVEIAGSTMRFSMRLSQVSGPGRREGKAAAEATFLGEDGKPFARLLPLQKRSFATLQRSDISWPVLASGDGAYRTAAVDVASLSEQPLLLGERAWLGARAVTADRHLVEIIMEMPPAGLLEEVQTAWRVAPEGR